MTAWTGSESGWLCSHILWAQNFNEVAVNNRISWSAWMFWNLGIISSLEEIKLYGLGSRIGDNV